ncbi:MAG TPA: O-antigen ligase family protein [Gemmatimonadaceae bacterium]
MGPGHPGAAAGRPGKVESDELPPEISTEKWPWKGVQWNLTYAGFLGYIFAITTYRFPIGDVSIVCALVGLLMQREKVRVPKFLLGLGALILWAMVGYSMTRYPALVFDKLQIVLKLWFIALVAANALRTRQQIRFFLTFWLACFAFYPVRGAIFNYYIYRETIFGRAIWNYIYSNPNDLALYCILQLAMAFGLNAIEQKGPVRLGARLGMAVVPFLILITKSRGAFLGFAVFLAFVLSGHKKRMQALTLTLLVGGLVLAVAPSGVLDRVFALKKIQTSGEVAAADEEGSAEQRYEIWKVARSIIRENPIAGVGLGAYPAAHQLNARRAQFKPTARGPRDTHSTYLNLTAETGFVGLFIFLASYVGLLVSVEKLRRRAKKLRPHTAQTLFMLEVGLLGFFTAATFGSAAHISFLILHATTMWCIAELIRKELDNAAARRRKLAYAPAPLGYATAAAS